MNVVANAVLFTRKRLAGAAVIMAALVGVGLSACNKEESTSKSTTTKTSETPEGTKKTTETTERKVEVEKK